MTTQPDPRNDQNTSDANQTDHELENPPTSRDPAAVLVGVSCLVALAALIILQMAC